MSLGPTHWRLLPQPKSLAIAVAKRFLCSWNTYVNHPDGYWLDDVSVDFWGAAGRGAPIGTLRGWAITKYILARRRTYPVKWLIWNGRAWRPETGWQPYNNWWGTHWDHVHVTFNYYSQTGGRWPQW